MTPLDVLSVGATAYDLYFMVDHAPEPDEKTTADAFRACGGGPAANAAVTAARMGLSAGLAGYLGRDPFGERHLAELRAAGVETRWVVRGDAPTPVSAVWVGPDGRRALVNYRAPEAVLTEAAADLVEVSPSVMLFDGHQPSLSEGLLPRARRLGIPTVLDAGSVHPGTLRLFEAVDYLVCSETFARNLTDRDAHDEALSALSGRCPNVVITLGARGLVWRTREGTGALPAFPVEAVDTTGAGDVFHGAFAGCLAQGRPWPETLRYAGAAAALGCTRIGARTGIPTGEEVTAFLKARS